MNATETHNSQDRAYWHLKNAVIDLDLKPGQKVTAQEIATSLNISRTPVREAFGRLEQEGLLVRHGGWGYSAPPVRFKDAMNVFGVREVLEVQAIKEVVPRITPELLICLEGYLGRAEEQLRARRISEYRLSTRAFYSAIAHATDNEILEYMLSLIADRVRRIGAVITDKHFERPVESLAENRNILHSLKRRDESRAVAAVRKHVSHARESFLRYVMEKSELFSS